MPFHFNWQVEVHPVIVHFAVGLLCFALLLDAIGAIWKSQSARLAALYCLIGGTVATVLGVVTERSHQRPVGGKGTKRCARGDPSLRASSAGAG